LRGFKKNLREAKTQRSKNYRTKMEKNSQEKEEALEGKKVGGTKTLPGENCRLRSITRVHTNSISAGGWKA